MCGHRKGKQKDGIDSLMYHKYPGVLEVTLQIDRQQEVFHAQSNCLYFVLKESEFLYGTVQ